MYAEANGANRLSLHVSITVPEWNFKKIVYTIFNTQKQKII